MTSTSVPPQTTSSYSRSDSGEERRRETRQSEVTETRTTIEDEEPVADLAKGDKAVFTKTVITEKEEKMHKTEVG